MTSCQCRFITTFLVLNEVAFFGVLCYLSELILKDLNEGHTIIGQDISLECTVASNNQNSSIEWKAPLNLNLTLDRVNTTNKIETVTPGKYIIKSLYTISKSVAKDSSVYYCQSVDGQNPFDAKYKYIWVPVYGMKEHVINFLTQPTFFDKANLELGVYIEAHPETTFTWIDKNNETISKESTKFTVNTTSSTIFGNYKSVLKFNNMEYENFGNYTIIADNMYERKAFTVSVNITGPPYTIIKIVHSEKEFNIIKSQSTAFPRPSTTWEFQECNGLSCFQNEIFLSTKNGSKRDGFSSENYGLQTISDTAVYNSSSGLLRAVSSNVFGTNSSVQYIYRVKNFQVIAKNMIVTSDQVKVEALHNEDVEIMCAVSLRDYHYEIKWFREGRNLSLDDMRIPIKKFDEYHIRNFNAVYSSVSVLKFNIDKRDGGEYYCKATTKDGKIVTKMVRIITRELPTLNVASNMQNKTVLVRYGQSSKFYCNVGGYPTPSIKWYKNNVTIVPTPRLQIKDNNQTLAIDDVGPTDNGTYTCQVSNRIKQINIKTAILGAIENDFDWLMVIIIILVLTLIAAAVVIALKVRKDNKLKNELKAMGLAYFEEGAVENINSEMRLDDQAEYLPYDKKWEIPVENLTLGKELGSGAFGVVVKGELSSFPTKDETTTVAVKMVNKFAGHDCIKALASELKIMVHLGQHVNIVNLIGACTKDITKKKLLVVVEFCAFGSLHEHILYNTNNFIDQRRKDKDGFDWTIGPPHNSHSTGQKLQYTTMSISDTDSTNPDYEKQNHKNECYAETEKKFMCSQDFVAWAFQISKGMEYLASRKLLHGDLAARNVLLSEDNVVKISDFGLARSMYKNDIYKKTANGPLPIKWLAVESIGEKIFSTQSDVWSFGIVLWELFSIGKTPYPGIPMDQNFYKSLLNGYRMEIPEYATTEIYEMMLECWNASPMTRPTFTELAEKLGSLLEPPVKNHYLEMNSGYVTMSTPSDLNADYLSMMSSPDFENIIPKERNYADYLHYFDNCQTNLNYVKDMTDSSDKCNDAQ